MRPGFIGSVEDAAAGLIGSREWVASRAKRFDGAGRALSADEMAEFARRFSAAAGRAGISDPRFNPAIVPGYETGFIDGRIQSIGDADDETPFCAVDETAKIRRRHEAERIYNAICNDECGIVIDPELHAKKRQEKAALRALSHAIARNLELAEIPAYRSGEWSLWVYGIHSGEVEIMPQFRRVAFIPYVAAAIREPFVRSLEFFLQTNLWCRFWTFSNGPRCRLSDLRASIKKLNRRLSRLNNQAFLIEAGVRLVFRSIELGTIEKGRQAGKLDPESGTLERDENGVLWFHPHAHCVVVLEKGRLAPAKWAAMLERVWSYWGDHWDDGGTIRSVREAVKYVTKPNEIHHLTPEETKELFEALSRCKLAQPMGRLRDEIRAREEAGRTLIRQRTDDGFVWIECENWNSRGKSPDESSRIEARDMGAEFIGPGEAVEFSERSFVRGTKLRTLADKADVDACVVVARCTPAAGSLGIKEPRVVVMGKRLDLAKVQAHPLVDRLWVHTYDAWHAGLALIRVHTGTPTVRERPAFRFMPDLLERVEPPGEPVFSGFKP